LHQAIGAIREKNNAIIVEGYFDLLRLADVGIENVVASSGTALTERQGRLLKRYTTNIMIAYDGDEAGLKAAIRNSEILESLDFSVNIIQIPEPHDPDSFILENGKKAFFDLLKNKKNPMDIRINKFLKDSPAPSLDQKNSFVDDVIFDLLSYRNDVKVGYYLHKISERLEITESLLVSRYNNIKRKKKYSADNNETKKETTTKFLKGEWRAEEGVISAILNAPKDTVKEVINNLSSSDFENNDLREIYEAIVHFWEENNKIDINRIKDNLSEELLQVITRLSFFEIENIEKYTRDCIYQLRKWHLNVRYSELRRMLQEESSSPESVTHYMKQLAEIKNSLLEVEEQHKKTNIN